MTIAQARKLLGKACTELSDEELLREIAVAEMLKNWFFDLLSHSTSLQK